MPYKDPSDAIAWRTDYNIKRRQEKRSTSQRNSYCINCNFPLMHSRVAKTGKRRKVSPRPHIKYCSVTCRLIHNGNIKHTGWDQRRRESKFSNVVLADFDPIRKQLLVEEALNKKKPIPLKAARHYRQSLPKQFQRKLPPKQPRSSPMDLLYEFATDEEKKTMF